MLKPLTLIVTLAAFFSNANAGDPVKKTQAAPAVKAATKPSTVATEKADNPLLADWTGSYGTVPPFDKVTIPLLREAMIIAMENNLMAMDNIANNKEEPTFENTIVAMERSGRQLENVMAIYGVWSSTMSTKEFQKVEEEIEPRLAQFSDKIYQNIPLYKRISAVNDNKGDLNTEQKRLVENYFNTFSRSGAKLNEKDKEILGVINQNLASLYTSFSQNLLADEMEKYVVVENADGLKGLPQSIIDAMANNAAKKKLPGKWVVTNTRSSVEPFLTYAEDNTLRNEVWTMFTNRGNNADKNDNNSIISKILALRQEKAQLLGYTTHAHWRLEDSMAKSPEAAMKLMESVWPAAVQRVDEEVQNMQEIANKEGGKEIQPSDYRFYAEKVRKAKYDLNQDEVKQYLQLEKLREGMFMVAGELFNFSFTPVKDVPVYHPDVKVWQVKDKTSGELIGLWYFDPYAREGKRSGAWMNAYRNQQNINGNYIPTIVSNNANFIKGKPGEPILISWEDATTLFHEFGHALHGLSSNVTYPSLSGTNVYRDYVEFPSQLLEHWLSTPEVLSTYAINPKTGKSIPKELIDKIKNASKFNQGFKTVEYLSSALVDMKLHLADAKDINPQDFEAKTLAELGMPKQVVMRHRTSQFGHIFSSDGYSAGYYSYLWSDVLTADAFTAFAEAGGPYDKRVAKNLSKNIFSVGNTIDPAEGYRNFRGREAQVEALMRKRGFIE